jgi:MFS family permease
VSRAEPARAAPGAEDERWLNRGVTGIGSASLLSDLGHEVPSALLPSFLTSTLGAPAAALGLIEGIADASSGVARLAGGARADDPERRRRTAVGGYTATAVLSSLIGLTMPPRAYGRAYGFERMMDNLGAVGGPLLALALVSVVSTRTAIVVSVIPGLLAALAIVYAIHVTRRPEVREHRPIRLRPVLHGRLGRILGGVSAFELGNVAATLLILRAIELLAPEHGQNRAEQLAIGLYVAYNAAAAVSSVPGGHLGDRRSPLLVLALGAALSGAAYAGFALAGPSVAVLGVFFVAAGVAIGLVETAEHAAVATHAPEELRGSAFGALAGIQSLGNFASSAIAGILWTAVSPRAAFLYLAAWMVLSLAALAWARSSS